MNFLFAEQSIDYVLNNKTSNHLVIENPGIMDRLVIALKERVLKESERVRVYDEDVLDFNKVVQVCFSPAELVFDKRELQKRLLCDIVEIIENTELATQISEAQAMFSQTLSKIKIEADYDIDVEEDMGMEFFLKAFNVHLKNPEGDFPHRFVEYILTIHRLLRKRLFVFVGCQSYIRAEDLNEVIRQLSYEEIYVLFVDGYQRLDLSKVGNHYIIDTDMCEIH